METRKAGGGLKAIPTIQVYHGAIVYWYAEIHRRPPANFDTEWSELLKGAKHIKSE